MLSFVYPESPFSFADTVKETQQITAPAPTEAVTSPAPTAAVTSPAPAETTTVPAPAGVAVPTVPAGITAPTIPAGTIVLPTPAQAIPAPASSETPSEAVASKSDNPPSPPSFDEERLPAKFHVQDVPHVRQLPNYCGPASMSMVLGRWGKKIDQRTIANAIYDKKMQATNGADMLLLARELGFASYSLNSNPRDLKQKLASGMPVIVQQYFSSSDNTYHFRVVVGYNDNENVFVVSDPEESGETKISYSRFTRLWQDFGNWALLIIPTYRDEFSQELNDKNPVLHMDLATAYFRKASYAKAEAEARKALKLDPGNRDMEDLVSKIRRQRQAAGPDPASSDKK